MGKFLYNIGIALYGLMVRLIAPYHPKARLWTRGRAGILQQIEAAMQGNTAPVAWFHSASLGEFEQARPVMEQFRAEFPQYRIFLTFFSPSGYEIRKNYAGADYIFYMPTDTEANAQALLHAVRPSIAFFVKYEFWYHYLHQLQVRRVPVISFSAIFRPNQVFFKRYGQFYRNILSLFTHIFVQNQSSLALLQSIKLPQISIGGDTRFDRVKAIAEGRKSIPLVEQFKDGQKLFIVGSAWPQDLDVLMPFFNTFEEPIKIIIAPHELGEAGIKAMQEQYKGKSLRFSQATAANVQAADLLLIDNIGMLSSLYAYADFAWIGGAYGSGLHNTLEAAVYGIPVLFGRKYNKFQEAVGLVAAGGAFSVLDTKGFAALFEKLYHDEQARRQAGEASRKYVLQNTGATPKIIAYCHQVLKNG